VEDDEVADIFINIAHTAIVFFALDGADGLAGEQRKEARNTVLNQMDAGRFQGLQEA
jgi:hypothetical protein